MNRKQFQRVQNVFELALECEGAARDEFVEKQCGHDPELKQEVVSLLAAHDRNDSFLESNILAAGAEPLQEGETVGPYRVIRELGRGGMGVVYLAEDFRLGRRVALKALALAVEVDGKKRERFRREARLAASLSHPAIATVYALEEVGGHLYIASEFVDGRNLREELLEGPLPLDELIDSALQIARGLAAAHEGGVIHRDLKPENILRDRDGRLKILDFGLALLSEPESAHMDRLTQDGSLVGTPAYMSPEQLLGKSVDARADIFSFGVLVYELATGAHPFSGNNPIHTVGRILEAPPNPFSEHDVRAPHLERVLDKCLQKEPEDRYRSIDELVRELKALETSKGQGGEGQSAPRIHPRPSKLEPSLGSYWWVVHQVGVMILYASMVAVLWDLQESRSGTWPLVLSFSILACAIVNGTLRTHLLFTSRFNRSAIVTELRQVRMLKRLVDGLFCLFLLAAAATVLGDHQILAGILAAVSVGYAVVFLVVEPATVRSIFTPEARP